MQKNPPAVVLYLGPEEGEKQQAIKDIIAQATAATGQEPEEHRRYAFDTAMQEITELLQGGSLFGSYTVVLYRNADLIRKKDDIEALKKYLKNPSNQATLILETSQIRVERNLEQAVGSANKRIFWEMFENQKQGWVAAYVRRHGSSIDSEAAELLLELVPNNTLEMGRELDQLMAFVGRHISVEDVDRYIYHGREESVFTLYDAVIENDLERCLEISAKILADGEAVQVIAGLTWQFDQLSRFQALRQRNVPDAKCFDASNLNVRSKRTQKLIARAAQRYDDEAVLRVLRTLNDFDGLLRSLPQSLHVGLVTQALYSVVRTDGRWTPTLALESV